MVDRAEEFLSAHATIFNAQVGPSVRDLCGGGWFD